MHTNTDKWTLLSINKIFVLIIYYKIYIVLRQLIVCPMWKLSYYVYVIKSDKIIREHQARPDNIHIYAGSRNFFDKKKTKQKKNVDFVRKSNKADLLQKL